MAVATYTNEETQIKTVINNNKNDNNNRRENNIDSQKLSEEGSTKYFKRAKNYCHRAQKGETTLYS